jgi:hypothetical protein
MLQHNNKCFKDYKFYINIMSELEDLPMVPSNQNYVCISFLVKKEGDQLGTSGVRIGGVFNTYDEACAQAKKIQEHDNLHHVYVGETKKWLPYNPDPESEVVQNTEYANEQLNNLMKGHKENMEKSRIYHELRKTEKIMDNINENIEERNRTRDELTSKLSKVKNMTEAQTLTKSLETLETQIKGMEERLNNCKDNDSNLKEELQTLENNSKERMEQSDIIPPASGENNE